jgi:two-component system OmpR family sensor kinase
MTVAFAVGMVLVLAVAALFVYVRLASDLSESLDGALRARSDDVAALLRRSGLEVVDAGGGAFGESEEGFIQVLAADGRLLGGTSGVRAPAARARDARRAANGPTTIERAVPGVDGTARMLARPVAVQGRPLVLVVGASLEDREDALSDVLASFLIGGPIAVVLASGIGYVLAAAGFAPVEAMRRRAQRISLARSGERLPLPAAHDEIRRLGETLNEMLARLEASFERERRFVADAGHELRTPLAVVKAELEAALRNEAPGSQVHDSLVAALDETDHLVQLADDLLVLARAADGRLPVRREAVDVRDLLERTRARFADRAAEQARAIAIDAPDRLDMPLDSLRARQALANLVDNALRHGAGDVRLTARRDRDAVEIDVHDDGPGFSPDLAARAFERFAAGDDGRTAGGTGLGLAIVRAIAEAHAGSATIVATPPPGATVRLRMPAHAGSGTQRPAVRDAAEAERRRCSRT